MSRVRRSFLTRHFYTLYKERTIQKGHIPKSREQYTEIIGAMGDAMSEILLERGIVRLPWKNGEVFLVGEERKDGVVNYEETRKHKQEIRSFNDHSDGLCYSAFWLSQAQVDKKRKLWSFSLFRDTKRALGKLLKAKQVSYPDFKMMLPQKSKK